jgi:heterotetrameric sarcosine oxidase gamma subunit
MTTHFLTSPLEPAWMRLDATVGKTDEGWRVPVAFGGAAGELQAAREGVVLGDDTPRGKIRVQGDGVDATVRDALGQLPEHVGRMAQAGAVEIVLLRPDLCHVGTTAPGRDSALAALTAACRSTPVTITDVTHGRFELRLVGPAAPVLLSKVCGIDFHGSAFGTGQARETSVAKTRQLVIRADLGDLPAYRLIGGRGLGLYIWDTLMEAGRDLGVEPIGADALLTLAG